MNTSPATLNPVSANPAQSAKGKPQESASDSPFSRVLSSEIAQNRRNAQADSNNKPETRQEDTIDQVDTSVAHAASPDKTDGNPLAAAYDILRTEASQSTPDTFLALAIPMNLAPAQSLKPQAAIAQDAEAVTLDTQTQQEPRKNPLTKALQAAQADQSAGAAKPDLTQSAKSASAFAGQLAAAQQSDTANNGEQMTELMANSALRNVTQVAAEPSPLAGANLANRLAPSVGTTAWGQALGEKIVWMAAGAQQTASLTLNPPNLGPLQIVLNISNEQATASFFSAQPEVRQALEAAFPRLREMMNEAGIQLGQATVSSETPQQQAFDTPTQRKLPGFAAADEATPLDLTAHPVMPQRVGRGLVDTFA